MANNTSSLFDSETLYAATPLGAKANSPVRCLGKDFKNDDERRAYYREELRKQLPELKKLEGFPIGEDDDIIELSDPPYYTACPNPWLNDFVAEWELDKQTLQAQKKRKADFEVHEPYASDVSEGKNNPIYNAHSYHTKVPHPAIMRYILHYTQPGDIVLDGFAGTGMTGVAAQLCGNPDPELKFKIESEFTANGLSKPVWGTRKAICGDLSPIASFIAYNYNTPVDVARFEQEAKRILAEVETECGWMYETRHTDGSKGKINYTVWSDVFVCSGCGHEIVFWEAAVDKEKGEVKDEFACPHCHAIHTKRGLSKAMLTIYDRALNQTIRQAKTIPVLINYSANGKRHEKFLDAFDLALIKKIDDTEITNWYPTDRMLEGGESRRNDPVGITHVHHFYTKRNLFILSMLNLKIDKLPKQLRFWFNSALTWVGKENRLHLGNYFGGGGGVITSLRGTWYISSLSVETNVQERFLLRVSSSQFGEISKSRSVSVFTNSCSNISAEASQVDYIFTDPPFGANIMYSELNFLWESWLKVKTDNRQEAIENSVQKKSLFDYQQIMICCFKEYYRVLKPGRWMTVEFSNTGAAVWNSIQTGLQQAGFIIANVAALDKQKGSFKAVTTPTAVKQDLVISCYKPSSEFDQRFRTQSGDVNVWAFVDEHLAHLPVSIIKDQKTTAVIERSPKILYDRMLSFFLMRNLPIPIDAAEFQQKLAQRYRTCDGMIFTADQLAEYEAQKRKLGISNQITFVFDAIYSESEAIAWLKEKLEETPAKRQDLYTDFRKANAATRKGEKELELSVLLDENFIEDSEGRWRVPDHNEAKDREALRTKARLKEFNQYLEALGSGKVKKIKDVRIEALRVGFRYCWEKKEWATIVNLGDKVPQNLLMEDEQLLMYYDIARDRM